MANLSGKVAIVLGAGSAGNMGQHIARAMADAGAKVVVSGRNTKELTALAGSLAGDWIACDITAKAEVETLARTTLDRHGKVDIAVNASGWGLLKSMHEITEDELDGIVALQFKGVHHFLSAFVRAMPAGGSLIQISSADARKSSGFADDRYESSAHRQNDYWVDSVENALQCCRPCSRCSCATIRWESKS